MEERMLAFEKEDTKNLEEPSCKTAASAIQGMGGRPTYASIVAPPANKAAAKLHIDGAFIVRKLRGNDTEVFLQSVSQRDAALSMAQPKKFCVLMQDYPVEILGIPFGTFIRGGKKPNNGEFINQVVAETKVRIPELKINRVRWLFEGKEHRWMGANGHTRGSIVASLPTEALQREVIRNGNI
ncbi:Putative uncharachterized protein [Blumeria hordei DH14]|uniref:Uncharacterized protein n=1 Tax=Blumeria graminis f. sp. hordei (strain DH14) TaxID=546991 RepID=N1JFU6_BLUG1|nr:Putative uncharachterized protein [Blumeria hordei DH14]